MGEGEPGRGLEALRDTLRKTVLSETVVLRLDVQTLARVDALAGELGSTRSEVIRACVRQVLGEEGEAQR